jgi:hypothetical protein
MSSLAWPIEACLFLLQGFIEQFMPMTAQEHKQFRVPDLCRNVLLCSRKLDRRLPQ